MPTCWHPQIDLDRMLFGGHEPTVWLQEHLKSPHVRTDCLAGALAALAVHLLANRVERRRRRRQAPDTLDVPPPIEEHPCLPARPQQGTTQSST